MCLLVSVHLPKTGGSSFRSILKNHYQSRLQLDYNGSGIGLPPLQRHQKVLAAALKNAEIDIENTACIHGHFQPIKYLLLKDIVEVSFVTWMRHPVDRMISHYFYWQRAYDSKHSAPHHKRVIEESWSLEQFCFSEVYQNIYTQYLWAFPLEYFSFIGIMEWYDKEFEYFSEKYLGEKMQVRHENKNTQPMLRENLFSHDTLRKLEEFHRKDMRLYERAVNISKSRSLSD